MPKLQVWLIVIYEMSSTYDSRFVISFTDFSSTRLKYVFQQREKANKVLLRLSIKSDYLATWRQLVSDSQTCVRCIDLVNLNIPGNVFILNRNCKRLESRLYELGNLAETKRNPLNKKGNPNHRNEFFAADYKEIAVLKDEVITVDEWTSELCKLEQKLGLAKQGIESWKEKFHDLEKEKEKLF